MTQKFNPLVRQRVRVRGRSGVYFVLALNREDKIASLINLNRANENAEGVERVPLADLVPLGTDEAIRVSAA